MFLTSESTLKSIKNALKIDLGNRPNFRQVFKPNLGPFSTPSGDQSANFWDKFNFFWVPVGPFLPTLGLLGPPGYLGGSPSRLYSREGSIFCDYFAPKVGFIAERGRYFDTPGSGGGARFICSTPFAPNGHFSGKWQFRFDETLIL